MCKKVHLQVLMGLAFVLTGGGVWAGEVEWEIIKPSNTGIPGEEVRVVRWAPDGKLWVAGRWPHWLEGGIGIYDFDTQVWSTITNWETPLPSEFVNDIDFAADGSVWIATSNGLMHLEGENWTRYSTINSPLLDNVIASVDIGADGHLWINNSGGQNINSAIFEFDGTNWTQFRVGQELPWSLPWEELSHVIVDHLGHVWVANAVLDGVAEYDGETWTLHGDGVDRFGAIMEDHDGNIWLKSGIGGWNTFWKFDRTTFTEHAPDGPPTTFSVDDDGTVYTGDWFGNVRKTTDGGQTWIPYLSGLNFVLQIVPDPNSTDVWIGTNGAVGHFNAAGQLIRDYNSYNTGMPWYWIDNNMSVDRSGYLWMSVGETGASRFDGQRWRNWGRHNAGSEYWPFTDNNEPIGGVYEDRDGNIYMGGNGIARWNHDLTEVTGFWNWENNPDMGVTLFRFFAHDKNGDMLAFTKHATPFRLDTELNLWVREPIQPYAVSSFPGVDTDSSGNVWVAGWFDIYKWDGIEWTQMELPHPNYFFDLGGMTDFKIGPGDVMYMATFDGLVIYDGETFSHYDQNNSPMPARQVMGLDVRDDGLIGLACWTNQPIEPWPSAVVVIDGPAGDPANWHSWLYGQSPLTHYQTDEVAFDANGDLWVAAWSEGVVVLKTGAAFNRADINDDGAVDLADHAALADCMTGPTGGPVDPGCEDADIDRDGDVDVQDFQVLQEQLE